MLQTLSKPILTFQRISMANPQLEEAASWGFKILISLCTNQLPTHRVPPSFSTIKSTKYPAFELIISINAQWKYYAWLSVLPNTTSTPHYSSVSAVPMTATLATTIKTAFHATKLMIIGSSMEQDASLCQAFITPTNL